MYVPFRSRLVLPSSNADRLAWAGAGAAVAAAVAIAASTLMLIVRTYSPLPFWDQWETVLDIGKLRDGTFGISDLVLQHNEHRLVFPRLVFYADALLFKGRNLFDLAVILAVQAAHAAILIRLIGPLRRPAAAAVAALTVALMLFAGQWENLVWGFQVQFVGLYLLATGGYLLIAKASGEEEPRAALWLGLGAACLFVGVFSMASGMAALAIGVALSLVLRAPRWMIVVLIVELMLCAALYFRGFHAVPGNSTFGYAMTHLADYLTYLCAYVGNVAGLIADRPPGAALSRLLHPAPILLGAAGLGLAAAALVREGRRGFDAPTEAVLLAVMAFVLAGAALTAVGRLQLGVEQAHASRYQTPGAIFWSVQAIYWTRASLAWKRLGRTVVGLGVAGAFGLIVWSQAHLAPVVERHGVGMRIAEDALRSRIRDNGALGAAFDRPGDLWDRAQILKAHGLSIYADETSGWLGQGIAQIAAPARPGACVGAFDIVTSPLSNAPSEGQTAGWAWDAAAGRPPRRVLLTNAAGAVTGFASLGVRRPDVAATLGARGAALAGWSGFARLDGGPVRAVALLSDGTACEVGVRAGTLRPS